MWVLFLVSPKMESAYIRSISHHILIKRIFTDRQQPTSQEQEKTRNDNMFFHSKGKRTKQQMYKMIHMRRRRK